MTKNTTKAAKAKAPAIHFFHDDDVPMAATQNRLSAVAWFFTEGIKRGKPRLSTDELRKVLAKLGVKDPESTDWKVTLPNGRVVGAVTGKRVGAMRRRAPVGTARKAA